MLVEMFLLQLDKLLTVPNLKQVTYNLSALCSEDILGSLPLQY